MRGFWRSCKRAGLTEEETLVPLIEAAILNKVVPQYGRPSAKLWLAGMSEFVAMSEPESPVSVLMGYSGPLPLDVQVKLRRRVVAAFEQLGDCKGAKAALPSGDSSLSEGCVRELVAHECNEENFQKAEELSRVFKTNYMEVECLGSSVLNRAYALCRSRSGNLACEPMKEVEELAERKLQQVTTRLARHQLRPMMAFLREAKVRIIHGQLDDLGEELKEKKGSVVLAAFRRFQLERTSVQTTYLDHILKGLVVAGGTERASEVNRKK